MATDFACPKCQSEHVQKISIIVEQGTTEINTESSSAGVAVGFGGAAVGGGKTVTSGTAQSELAKKFSLELKDESDFSLTNVVGFIVSAIAGVIVGGWIHGFWGWVVGILSFAIVFTPFIKFDEYLDKTIFKKSNEEKTGRQQKKDLWKESGFYCNRCAAKFVPGTDEAYTFSEQ